ncbi:MAG: tetratricopeptide repeat protein [Alphaproteobacteria bacterium]|nr:tetratricopeptide repeat protein [Alphaproteobacteria bacterium]
MTDFIQEVDEDLRRDQYKRLWDKYGKFAVVAAVMIILGVAGTVAYRDWAKSRRAEDTRKLVEAVELSATDPKLGPDALASLAKSAGAGVSTLARLHQAAALVRSGQSGKAIETYDQLAGDGSVDTVFRDLAVLLAAQHRADGPEAPSAALKLAPLTQAGNPWRHPALELTAVIALGQGDKTRARNIFRELADDAAAPVAIRGRAAEMAAALAD